MTTPPAFRNIQCASRLIATWLSRFPAATRRRADPRLALADRVYFLYMTFNIASCIHFVSAFLSPFQTHADPSHALQFFMYPETKGRTLEEMEEIFDGTNTFTAWRVPKSKGPKSVGDVESCISPSTPCSIRRLTPHTSSAGRTPSMGDVDEKDLKGETAHVETVHPASSR